MRWRLFFFDIAGFVTASSLFLYINPSQIGRLRLIYIAFQVFLCTLIVFLFRYYFRVYRKNVEAYDLASHDDLLILFSDLFAGTVIYLIQLLIPDTPSVRISFVQVVCIIGINLFIGTFGRQAFRSLIRLCNQLSDEMENL